MAQSQNQEILIKAKELLKNETTKIAYETWIQPLDIRNINDNVVTLIASNSFQKDTVETRYIDLITNTFNVVIGKKCEVKVVFGNEVEEKTPNTVENAKQERTALSSGLNPKYTFENYVIGSNNTFAQAAALGIAENPGYKYNPLFLYGGPGLGKTHLMHAIGNYVLQLYPDKKVLYVTSETFTNQLINALKEQSTDKFREKYSPWSGCLVTILQFIIFISIFYLVSRPLTYMKKVDSEVVKNYVTQIQEAGENVNYPEIKVIQKFGAEDERVNLNMNFLGLDLTDVPLQTINANLKTPDGGSINFVKIITVMIIPVTYIILLFVTTKISNKKMMEMNSKNSKNTEVKSEEKIKNDDDKNEKNDNDKIKNNNYNNKNKKTNNKNNNSKNKNKSKNTTTAKTGDTSNTKDNKNEENNKNKINNKNNSEKNSSKNKNKSSQKNKEINFSKKQNKLKVKIENENNAEEKNVKIEKFEDENKEVEIKTTEIIDDNTKRADEKSDADVNQEEMMKMTNTMTWMMPLLSVSIALVAPLGLSLYWLSNLLFQLIERAIIDKISEKNKKEAEE